MKIFLTSLSFLAATLSFAQDAGSSSDTMPATETALDAAFAMGSGYSSQALSAYRTHGLGESNRFRIGYGLRISAFAGQNLDYITAPFQLSADPLTVDTLTLGSPVTAGLSAGIHLGYCFSHKLSIGFNIDALGVGFGASDQGTFISSDNDGSYPEVIDANPTGVNVLLVGDNDIGQLKSEFVMAYTLNEEWRVRTGADFTFSEYTTTSILTNDNDRFRYKAFMAFVGVSYIVGSTD